MYDELSISYKTNELMDKQIQRAEDFYNWCLNNKKSLIQWGLEWNVVKNISDNVLVLEKSKPRWKILMASKKKNKSKWEIKAALIVELKKDILCHFFFAYRNNRCILKKLKSVQYYQGFESLILGLKRLSVIGKNNPRELKEINFNMELLDQAVGFISELPHARKLDKENKEFYRMEMQQNRAINNLQISMKKIYFYRQIIEGYH